MRWIEVRGGEVMRWIDMGGGRGREMDRGGGRGGGGRKGFTDDESIKTSKQYRKQKDPVGVLVWA